MQFQDLPDRRRVVLQRLESLQRAGVMQLPRVQSLETGGLHSDAEASETATGKSAASPVTPARRPASLVPATPEKAKAAPSVLAPVEKKSGWEPLGAGSLFESGEQQEVAVSTAPTLQVLQQEVAGCTRCEELARTRTQTVFGVGNPDARLCFVGEAPGADEDRLGEPFVGRAGQLLTKIIEACRMKREDVYILNMIKCRPPGNRTPLPDEVANCRGYLERQLALIRPEFICCLGAVAAQNLLGTTVSISKLRGKVHSLRGAKVVCTYHPAYLLRNPAAKKDTWEDMKLLMREMGMEI